ncbi:MAG TPA: von Willebrand factor type A domain-containing protein, partial [Gemmatimonadales bacterium]|nr:von Willebrand factor type A domain-containing protein [Gemmatimonadales bacterium]
MPTAPRARRLPGLVLFLCVALASSAAAPVRFAQSTGRIEGRVRDGRGTALAGARVQVVGTALSALTDSGGSYRFAAVPTGLATLRATHAGHRSAEGTVTVRSGATATLDFTLNPTVATREDAAANPEPAASAPGNARVRKSFDRAEGITPRDELSRERAPAVGQAAPAYPEPWRRQREPGNTEAYSTINENRFLAAAANPLSTFSIDVDAASYSNVRRFLGQGTLPPEDAVRLEELVNYFPYRYADETGRHPFAVNTEVGPCPWAPEHRLVRIGLQARRVATRDLPPSNLVFLIDVSGSMLSPDKLPLVQQAFRTLVGELRAEDHVAIVVYAGAAGLVLPSTSGAEKATILEAIDRLQAGGSTAGGAGLRLAYDVAREHFDAEGNNRVILATDGDFNVGVSSDAEMVRLVERRREEGTFLTVLGFGTGNLKDSKMEQMADHGNGHYAYIDSFREARKVFVQEFGGTLFTVAKDVKVQVEFNPARVRSYRLLGYENRLLAREDFADDRKDAGELGAGHAVTALYEVVPVGADPVASGDDSLTYQQVTVRPSAR